MYDYQTERPSLLTDSGQRLIISFVEALAKLPNLFYTQDLINAAVNKPSDIWGQLACVDRLVELGKIREIKTVDQPGQHRVFAKA